MIGAYRYRPVMDRRPDEQTIRERAEFLAHEIFEDRLAPEAEIADAIEVEIKRFSAGVCSDSPPWFRGRWRDWHRGHGCEKDDGRPRSVEAQAEINAHARRARS